MSKLAPTASLQTIRGFNVDMPLASGDASSSGVRSRSPVDGAPPAMGQCTRCESILGDASGACSACGADVATFMVDGRYVVEAEIGRGGMGLVYRARDIALEREVALKLIVPWALDVRDLERRLRLEAAALAAVRSPHVVQVHSFGAFGDSWFFAMELVRGRGLSDILREQGALMVPRALVIARQIAAGLGALHDVGILHRDVKPSNVLIEERTARAVLIDLGIARRLEASGGTTHAIGTPAYMAPEQVTNTTGARLTVRADVYGFACVLFELLTGRPPFDKEDDPVRVAYRHVHEAPPAPSSIRAELGPFDAAFARALAKDPAQRPATALELVTELEAIDARPESHPPSPPIERRRPVRILIVGEDDDRRELARSATQITFHGTPIRLSFAVDADGARAVLANAPHDLVLVARAGAERHVPEAERIVTIADEPLELGTIVTALRAHAASWGLVSPARRSTRST